MDSPYTFVPETALDIVPDSIISRVIYKDSSINVTLFAFAPGQGLTEHTSARPATIHFLRGEGTLTVAGDRKDITPGSWLHMAPGTAHSVDATTPLVMLLTLLER